jgi:hypothetical protein
MSRTTKIRRKILNLLECCTPYPLEEKELFDQTFATIMPPIGKTEFDDAMLFLCVGKYIDTVQNQLNQDDTRWTITVAGLALLRQ